MHFLTSVLFQFKSYKWELSQIRGFWKLYCVIVLNNSWPSDQLQLACCDCHVFKKRSLSCFDYVRWEKQIVQNTSILTGWGLCSDPGACFGTLILHAVNDYQPIIQLVCLKVSDSKIVCLNRGGCKQSHLFYFIFFLITFANCVCSDFLACLTSR